MLALLESKVGEGLARKATEENVVACHIVEGNVVKDVSVAYDGAVAGREVAGVLLNDGTAMIKGEGDANAEGKQGGREASDSAEGINCGEARRQRWRGADCDPDVRWSDVEEANAGGWKSEEEKGRQCGRAGVGCW